MNYCIIWIIALIVFVLIEAFTYQLVTIWFAFGALGALLCALLPSPMYIQILTFLLLSIVTLAVLRPLSMKYLKSKGLKTNADSMIGRIIVITQEVNNIENTGKTKVNGIEWTVRSADGSVIEKGKKAEVKNIEGVKIIAEECK
ncbi:MAG: NfeD family protein [Firmicutes bacterium]|nr:NfeD family protein [Bacillota bacterium]